GTASRLSDSGARAELRDKLAPLTETDRRTVLRFTASEINRSMFRQWLYVQTALAVVVLALLLLGGGPWAWAGVAVVLVLAQWGLHFPILAVGQSIDFLPRPLSPDTAARFGRLHGAYVLIDFVKMAALGLLAWRLR